MLVIGFQGSPRSGGNTDRLLSAFLDEAEKLGAETIKIDVGKMNISHCIECRKCEEEGYCVIDDDMQKIYPLLRRADLVVLASPVFFYGLTGMVKAVVDRAQALWARRYVLKLDDPGVNVRKGLLLALGATKGENLFAGVSLEAKYFFDAVGALYSNQDRLTYRKIENSGDIEKHPTAIKDVREKAREMVTPLVKRRRVLYVCTENAYRSQMAWAFTRHKYGDRIEAMSAGSSPAERINEVMAEAMAEVGIDMAYITPRSLNDALKTFTPDLVVTMGCVNACPIIPNAEIVDWDLPDPAGTPLSFMREVRDEIERRVNEIV
ncbi:MAG: NAD(P)H-dependent oxidoreductase [Deltaproteobacteria bacterium]|uniref:NAD(P)H-dependent oxidoreductase n=1 Tax=Candidatus Zymogenus saltonus TaxID=2844893 RepID=A0A9D8KB69_9DELT|nr:NAD(P)H-dependent oxidoreductase [Candidatus Zymogenus saltonus]